MLPLAQSNPVKSEQKTRGKEGQDTTDTKLREDKRMPPTQRALEYQVSLKTLRWMGATFNISTLPPEGIS